MNRNLTRISNILLYFLFCALAGTGLLLERKTPLDEGESTRLLGLRGEDWGEVHLWLGIAVVALVVCHLALNWRRMSKTVLGGRLWRSVTTVAVGILMVVGLLFAPLQDDKGVKSDSEMQQEMDEHEEEEDE